MKVGSYDLSAALALADRGQGPYAQIVRALRNLEAAQAALADLYEADKALDASFSLPPPTHDNQTALFFEALFIHALMLYCRAVHSDSKGRSKVDVQNAFASTLRASHKRVTAIRDQVVAHYGKGTDQAGGPWIKDHVAVHVTSSSEFLLSYPQMRAATKATMNADLRAVVYGAIDYLQGQAFKKQEQLREFLKGPLQDDQVFQGLLSLHPFSEEVFFGRRSPPGTPFSRVQVASGTKIMR